MSKQESRLSIAIESQEAVRNAKAVHKELKSIQETGDFAAKSVDGTSKSLTTFSQEGAKGASSAKVLAGQIGSVGAQSKSASDGLGKVTQSTNASAASMNMASTAAQALASRIMAIATVGAAVSKMDAFAGFENRLKLVTTSQTELNQAMNDTFRIAQSSRQEWDSVVQVYQRFSDNAKTLGIDMKKTAELTETVSKAVAISGASAQAAEAALTQFGQSLASGVFRGEELNSVLEQTPGLAKAIAQGMGITIGQLRAVAAEGKITTDVLVEALTKSKDNVDELFNRTDMTIGQSMTTLNNEIVKFVGEAGKTSGAAQAIAQSIQLISENLSAISSVAMLGGVAYLTKAILTKGNALRKSAGDALAARSAVQVLAVQEQQLAVAVLNDAKAHLASIQATGAATQSKYGATAAALRYKQALDQVSIAQAKVDSLGGGLAKFGNIASKGLALIGGPIGALTIGITGASAAYGYFSGKAEEATQKLAEQAKTADKTDESLKKLTGTERQKAIDDLTVTFADQEKQLRKQEVAMGSALIAIENYYGVLSKEAKIAQDARNGVISYNEALDELNKLKINKDMYDRLVKEIPKYDEASGKIQNTASKLKIYGIESEISGNKAQNAAALHNLQKDAIESVGNAAVEASKKLQDFNKSTHDRYLAARAELDYMQQGYSQAQARALVKAADDLGGVDSVILTKDQVKNTLNILSIEDKISDIQDKRTKATREQNRVQEKQNKLLAEGNRLVGISGNSGKSTGPHLHVQYPKGSNKGGVTKEHLARFQLGGKTLNPNNSNSPYGKIRSDGKPHGGWDFRTPVGTPITTNVAVKSVTTHQGKNAGYYSRVTFEDGVVIDLMHQVPGIDKKLAKGASDGKANSRTYAQQERDEAQFAKEGEALKADYYTTAQKDASDHQKRMTDLRKHGLAKEEEMEKERYEYTKQLRELEQILAADGWRWVGETKINNDAAVNALRIKASMDFSKDEKAVYLKSLEEKRQLDVDVFRSAQQEKQRVYEQEIAKRRRDIDDRMSRTKMSDNEYQIYSVTRDKTDALSDNNDQYLREIEDIKAQYAAKEILYDEHLKRLETAKKLHADNEQVINLEAAKKSEEVLKGQYEAQMQMYGQLLSQTSTIWGDMTQMIKDAKGENSRTYRAMFYIQKEMAIAQQIINTELAASATTAQTGIFGLPAAAVIRATGYAGVALIKAQQYMGTFADGGYTGRGGKYDPAGIVHKGEVVWSQEDIKRWGGPANVDLMRQGSPQSNPMLERKRLAAIGEAKVDKVQSVNIQSQIIINTPPGMSARTEQRDGKTYVTIEEVRDYLMDQLNRHNSDFNKEIRQRYELKPNRP